MGKAIFVLLLIAPMGCFPRSGNSLRPEPRGCPACAEKSCGGACPRSASAPPVSSQDVTPANARSVAKALQDEMAAQPLDSPGADRGADRPRR